MLQGEAHSEQLNDFFTSVYFPYVLATRPSRLPARRAPLGELVRVGPGDSRRARVMAAQEVGGGPPHAQIEARAALETLPKLPLQTVLVRETEVESRQSDAEASMAS